MVHNDNTDRRPSLMRLAPDIFAQKTVLYIGARPGRTDFLVSESSELGPGFIENGFVSDILEAFEPNANYFRSVDKIRNVYCGDVKDIDTLLPSGASYDVVFWWHGPEHVRESELATTVSAIERRATKYVVLGCPWGRFDQNAIDGNKYECHLAHLDHAIFEEMGYEVECLGHKNARGSNITAVKKINEYVL